jgi:hypothetical protein
MDLIVNGLRIKECYMELKNKNFYFLLGMPRAGNTLLGSLINQNKNISLTSNSITCEILFFLNWLKKDSLFENFPDHNSIDNIINNVFKNYYKDWKSEHIIDRSPWGTAVNLPILKKIIEKPKFIILYRPVLDCLASFIRIEKPIDVKERCHELMNLDGIIGKNLHSIKNIIDKKEDYIIVNYYDLVKEPLKEINKIYSFLKIDLFEHRFKNLNKFSVNNIEYNDSVLTAPLHDIRIDEVKLNKYSIENYLPTDTIEKYRNLDI